MKKIIYTLMAAALMAGSPSCTGSLDQYPHTSTTSNDVYRTVEGYQGTLGGIYAAMIQRVSSVSTEARSQNYIRTLMMFQDCSTDACDAVWLAGESLTDVNGLSWNAGDPWCSAMYYHIYNIVAMSNELIRNASDSDLLSSFNDSERAQIEKYRNEARFLRAYAYTQAIDFYNKMPFVTEGDGVGSYIPRTYDREQMFGYVTGELEEIAPLLDQTNYGHANRGAAYALLARLYLNGETWTGTPYYDECIAACKKVIEDGYSLESDYGKLFNGDNHLRTNEIIFALACDGTHTTTWDATTFITCGEVLADFENYEEIWGTQDSGAWNNLRARPELVDAFEYGDTRARIIDYDKYVSGTGGNGEPVYTETPRSKDIAAHDDATTGYRIFKWTNVTDAGEPASSCGEGGGANTDFPVFRLADVYLMLAEAVVRGGQGATKAEALNYVNQVRGRAFGSDAGNVGEADLTLDFLCAERLREMYMECIRRTDLIRFGKYTSGYSWQWKGNAEDGTDVDSKFRFLPVPEAEYSVNPEMQTINNELGY